MELSAFCSSCERLSERIYRVPMIAFPVDGKICSESSFLDTVGGIVKIAREIESLQCINIPYLADLIQRNDRPNRIVYGVSGYGMPATELLKIAFQLKHELEQRSIPSRFILPKNGETELTSVVVQKEHVFEIVLIYIRNRYLIGTTVGVQPYEAWGSRDFGRPYADARHGMLPPKVARMAVNIALGSDSRGKTLLDPFCGMGTIIAEGALRNVACMGNDQSPVAVQKAQKNFVWLQMNYPFVKSPRWIISDATHVKDFLKRDSIDAIVTEPYMGPSKIGEGEIQDPVRIKNIIRGLEKLYIGCLKDWHTILKKNSRIVIALPVYKIHDIQYSVKKVVDMCENLGYTILHGPVVYCRPQAIVQRNFYVLLKK